MFGSLTRDNLFTSLTTFNFHQVYQLDLLHFLLIYCLLIENVTLMSMDEGSLLGRGAYELKLPGLPFPEWNLLLPAGGCGQVEQLL